MARFSVLSAAVVALAFSNQAALVAGQSLDPCVQKSIRDAGCDPSDIKCMCKGSAEGSFLTDVLTSMVQYCPANVDVSGLFTQLNSGCKAAGYQIPPKNIADAQQLAGTVFGGGAGGAAGGSGGSSSSGGSTGGSSSGPSQAPSVTPKPTHTAITTGGAGAPVSQPTDIGESTAIISTGAGNANENSLITAPTSVPASSGGSTSGSGSGSSGNSGSGNASSSGASAAASPSASGKPENAGVRSTASLGAAVIGFAAAVMMW